ncbi:hypothetical protein [Paenibacillus sp. WLX2291]|uniref:hypothetical protein n=1 Tax=Paenibacillus sp. WLX2291 TaxID=3296934 RepID=UPI0039843275
MNGNHLFRHFMDNVQRYAEAYFELEEAQKDSSQSFIPKIGDQKTGVIGEAYIYQYLSELGHKSIEYGSASEKGWDIKYIDKNNSKEYKVQVKTVSGYSTTRIISPIHDGWDHLYLLSIDQKFIPDGLWLIDNPINIEWNVKLKDNVTNGKKSENGKKSKIEVKYLRGAKMKKNSVVDATEQQTTKLFKKATNEFEKFTKVMEKYFSEELDK